MKHRTEEGEFEDNSPAQPSDQDDAWIDLRAKTYELEKAMRRTRNRKDDKGLRIYSMSHTKARQELMKLLEEAHAQGRRDAADIHCRDQCQLCDFTRNTDVICPSRKAILGEAKS